MNDKDDPRHRDIGNLIDSAAAFGLSPSKARESVRRVAAEVARWPHVAAHLDISLRQQELMAPAFAVDQLERALGA